MLIYEVCGHFFVDMFVTRSAFRSACRFRKVGREKGEDRTRVRIFETFKVIGIHAFAGSK